MSLLEKGTIRAVGGAASGEYLSCFVSLAVYLSETLLLTQATSLILSIFTRSSQHHSSLGRFEVLITSRTSIGGTDSTSGGKSGRV